MWWFIGSSYIPSVLRGAGPVQPPIEGSFGCSEWSLQKIAFDFSLAANAVPHNERALGILHMIYRKLPKIHPSHPPLFAHYFEAKVGREGGGVLKHSSLQFLAMLHLWQLQWVSGKTANIFNERVLREISGSCCVGTWAIVEWCYTCLDYIYSS